MTYLSTYEIVLVLFLSAGVFKGDPLFAWFPVDLTLAFFCLSGILGVLVFMRNRGQMHWRPEIVVASVFFLYVVLATLWSPSSQYAVDKALRFGLLTMWALAGFMLVGLDAKRTHRLLFTYELFAMVVVAAGVWVYIHNPVWEFMTHSVFSSTYLVVSRVAGLGLIVAVSFILFGSSTSWVKAFWVMVSLISATFMFLAGGKGPLLAVATAGLVALPLGRKTARFGAGILLCLMLGFAVSTIVSGGGSLTVQRMQMAMNSVESAEMIEEPSTAKNDLAITNESGISVANEVKTLDGTQKRLVFYRDSIRMWLKAPVFGHGLGSWPLLAGFGDKRAYPHNIFLELLAETGIVGLSLFALLIAIVLNNGLMACKHDPARVVLLGLFVFTLMNAMVSGDLNDNRLLFAMAGLLVGNRLKMGSDKQRGVCAVHKVG